MSSGWIKEREPRMTGFAWQAGFGVFSVSASALESVEGSIARQEEHHRKVSFQDEFREFLRKHRVDWDERYAWE